MTRLQGKRGEQIQGVASTTALIIRDLQGIADTSKQELEEITLVEVPSPAEHNPLGG
jgi:hypothetical protein